MTGKRPLGVTVLAVWNYLSAVLLLALGSIILLGPTARTAALAPFIFGADDSGFFTLGVRGLLFAFCVFAALLSYFIGRGFWRLKNWARLLTIGVCVFDLIAGGPPSEIVGRVVSVLMIWYLISPQVSATFRHTAARQERPA